MKREGISVEMLLPKYVGGKSSTSFLKHFHPYLIYSYWHFVFIFAIFSGENWLSSFVITG